MRVRSLCIALRAVFLVILCAFSGPGVAAGTEDASQAARQKLNISLKQATLLEGMTQTACFAMSGVKHAQSRGLALEQVDGYATALSGLRNGHEWLGLEPETDPEIRTMLDAADTEWARFRPVIEQIAHGDTHTVVVGQLLGLSGPTRVQADQMSVAIFAAQTDLLPTHERQGLAQAAAHRMRTQRALKELWFLIHDIGGDAMPDILAATLAEIDAGFAGLSEGSAAFIEAPNARIKRNLRTAALFWSKMRPVMNAALAGETPDDAAIAGALKLNKSVLKQLNQAVEGYMPQG